MGFKSFLKKVINRKSENVATNEDIDVASFSVEDVPIDSSVSGDKVTAHGSSSPGNAEFDFNADFSKLDVASKVETDEISVSSVTSENSFPMRDDWDPDDNSLGSDKESLSSFDAATSFDREQIKDIPEPIDVKRKKVADYEFLEGDEKTGAIVVGELEKSGLSKVKKYIDSYDKKTSEKSFSEGLLDITNYQQRLINLVKSHYGLDKEVAPEVAKDEQEKSWADKEDERIEDKSMDAKSNIR